MVSRQPENINRLLENKFTVNFGRIPTTTYFCDQVNMPGIHSDNPVYPTMGKNIPLAGSKLSMDEFTMRFKVDEDLLSWQEIYEWIRGYSTPATHEQYINLKKKIQSGENENLPAYTDGIVNILTNKNYPNIRVHYQNIFPVSLSEIQFTSTTDNSLELFATAQFRYMDYTIERLR